MLIKLDAHDLRHSTNLTFVLTTIFILIAAACCLFIGKAAAKIAPAGAGTSLAIAITGHISPRCTLAMTGSGSLNLGVITDARTGRAAPIAIDLPLAITCNTPYVATLASKNGGLAYDGAEEPRFARLVNYAASLDMSQVAGGVLLSCDSTRMRVEGDDTSNACRSASGKISGVIAGQAVVKVRLAPGAQPLLKGIYQDELIVRLAPMVSG